MSDLVFLSPEYKQQVYEQWQRFQHNEPVDHAIVRELIFTSWQRCKSIGVDVFQPVQNILDYGEIQRILEKNSDLLECSSSIMNDVFSVIRASRSTMVLATSEGVVLRSLPQYGQGPQVGSVVREAYMGTAGIATCLEEQQPIKVFAAEHYCAANHGWSCSAAPIFNCNGVLVGALGVTSHCESFHLHTGGMIRAAVHAISEQLHLRELLGEQRTLMEMLDEGVVMLDADGRICTMNKKATAMLSLKRDVIGQLFHELVRFSGSVKERLEKRVAFNDEETSLRTRSGSSVNCIISASLNEATHGMVLTLREASRMRALATRLTGAKATYDFSDILGSSPLLLKAIEHAEKAAESDVTTLILGESGTGKELFAQAIHNRGARSKKPFIVVNCGALPRDLVQSELFGYAEGAFTGASSHGKPGKFELADGGSIFLDEIGEMPLDAQVSLLRLLQNGEVSRVGDKHTRNVDVRVIAATNRNLEEAVRQNAFRGDLFYRLNVFALNIPALREREGDIDMLVRYFLDSFSRSLEKNIKDISPEALSAMRGYAWPGNVRELQNALERGVHMASCPVLQLQDLPVSIVSSHKAKETQASGAPETPTIAAIPCKFNSSPRQELNPGEREQFIAVMRKHRGRIKYVADELGVARSTVYYKLKGYNLDPSYFRFVESQPVTPPENPQLTNQQLRELARQLKDFLTRP